MERSCTTHLPYYDTEMRKRATQLAIDPSEFSIGIWNDLEARYTAKKVLAMVQSDLKHQGNPKNSFPPNIPYTPTPYQQSGFYSNPQNPPGNHPPSFCPFPSRSQFSDSNLTKQDAYSAVIGQRPILRRTAQTASTSTAHHATYSEKAPLAPDRANLARYTASHGMASPVANRIPHANANIGAPYVDQNHTTLSAAILSLNLLTVNTPFIPFQWEKMLKNTDSFDKFRDIPTGMRYGFDMGIHNPPPYTYTPQLCSPIPQPCPVSYPQRTVPSVLLWPFLSI